ncbi:MAG: hypothetical protein KIT84_18100 [Labilithrix sp.]|nr:hypothetical protein [Labilithrix sp.]MCW5812946.1 hypothetical protein [Labilithrix sp.]
MAAGRGQTTRIEPWGVVLALALGAAFWVPALPAGRGWFPAPLDDVYIHFDYARSLGQGHPFEWIAGQGYSSGETSPLYALALALGWLAGFRGRALGVWAAIVAVASVASLLGSVRRLVRPCPPWLAWLLALVPLSIGVVDWALFSGMEVALFAAAIGRALEALAATRASTRGGPTRERRQWTLGLWGAALVLLRPEAVVLVAVFAVIAARGAGARSGLVALARAAAPGAIAIGGVLAANRLATGDARSAGAALKLLSSNPFLSDEERARAFVENLITFWVKVVRGELAVTPKLLFVLPLLAVLALVRRERRALAAACVTSAIAWTALVTWNGNAPYHNFRYYAPALLLVGIAASFAIASVRRRALAAAIALAAIGVAAPKVPGQVKHFRSASANIRDQHVEVGARVAAFPAGARVLLGDAGAIPYVSERGAIDALGLGGYRGVPFVRAAVHGEAAVIELIERLDPSARPTHLALYPNWFSNLTSRFGVEIDRVTIDDNVICGGTTKGIYRADWSALDVPGPRAADVVDELDVADVVDEAAHDYTPPLPHGGWTTLDVRAGRFDGGRTIPNGARESFVVRASEPGALLLRVRIDAAARGITLRSARATKELELEPPADGAWRSATATLDGVTAGERITLEAHDGEYRDYHVWLERPRAASPATIERDKLAR